MVRQPRFVSPRNTLVEEILCAGIAIVTSTRGSPGLLFESTYFLSHLPDARSKLSTSSGWSKNSIIPNAIRIEPTKITAATFALLTLHNIASRDY